MATGYSHNFSGSHFVPPAAASMWSSFLQGAGILNAAASPYSFPPSFDAGYLPSLRNPKVVATDRLSVVLQCLTCFSELAAVKRSSSSSTSSSSSSLLDMTLHLSFMDTIFIQVQVLRRRIRIKMVVTSND